MTSVGRFPGSLRLDHSSQDGDVYIVLRVIARNIDISHFTFVNFQEHEHLLSTRESLVLGDGGVSAFQRLRQSHHLEYVGQKALGAGPGAHPGAAETRACVVWEGTI